MAIGDEVVSILPPGLGETAFPPEALLAEMDSAGVGAALILQAPFYGDHNEYAAHAVEHNARRLAAALGVDPWQSGASQTVTEQVQGSQFVAVKIEFSEATGVTGTRPEARLDDPSIGWLWDVLAERRKPVVLDLGAVGSGSYQTEAIRGVAIRHPALRIVIAHLGQPSPFLDTNREAWQVWLEQLELGRLSNVWFDTASLPAYFAHEGFPWPGVGRTLIQAARSIGLDKLLWGTDLPSALLGGTYRQHLEAYELHLAGFGQAERDGVLGDNAREVFGGW